jgi:uncharacterized protein
VVPGDEALRIRNQRRLRALGIAQARGPEFAVEPADVGEAGEPAVVEGVKGSWRVDPALLGQPFSGGGAAVARRPAGGEARRHRRPRHRVLRVDAVHQDVPFDQAMTAAVDGEVKDLAHWLELDLKLPG